jgi:hypothetical protein
MTAEIKVTRFADDRNSVEERVNEFLDERGYGMEEVRIQFVTSLYSVQDSDTSGTEESLYEAYVTHPA